MNDTAIEDPLFRRAVGAIESGNANELEELVASNPRLVKERLRTAATGYFKDPYLLWFVADNPIRIDKLPANMTEITSLLIQALQHEALDTVQYQLDYTLILVASGRVVRECGVQIAMIDLLVDAGASPDCAMNALANSNLEAARHLIIRGCKLNLALAACLELADNIDQLATVANENEKLLALTATAYYGKADMVKRLLVMGANPNGYPNTDSGFHNHATPLHQAVSSGSLASVQLLVGAGAKLDVIDQIYDGTPLDWAIHLQRDNAHNETAKRNFFLIETYLRDLK